MRFHLDVQKSPAGVVTPYAERGLICRRTRDGIEAALEQFWMCAVKRRHSSAGANPARQLSLQPVAVGADDRGNDIV